MQGLKRNRREKEFEGIIRMNDGAAAAGGGGLLN